MKNPCEGNGKLLFKRVLIKLTGESLGDEHGRGFHPESIQKIARIIGDVHEMGVQVGIVVGGGNTFRGITGSRRIGTARSNADSVGMLATVQNGLLLMDAFEHIGIQTRVQSAIKMDQIAEPFIARRAVRHLEKGRVVIFVGGTGNPYYSTDSAAALRALQIGAEVLLKATKVDGIYDKDPLKFSDAVRFTELKATDALRLRLGVMDSGAFSMCLENDLPIKVFKFGDLKRVFGEAHVGTLVTVG